MVNGRGIGSDEDQRLVIRVLREHIAYRVDGAFMLPDQSRHINKKTFIGCFSFYQKRRKFEKVAKSFENFFLKLNCG